MDLVRTEDQELIAKTTADFAKQKSPIARVRELRDRNDAVGFSRELWKEMAELGWVGIAFPEAVGGAGLGFAELVIVLEELGRTLAPEPFQSTVLLGGQALALSGDEAKASAWLPRVCKGEAILALAQQEANSRYQLAAVETRAEKAGAGYRLSGEKIQVLDGHVADAFVVVARTAGGPREAQGLTLFLVPKGAAGLSVTRQARLDGRNAALVRLDGVSVGADAVVGSIDAGHALLEPVVDRATVGLCAEMLGGMQQAFALTVEHLKSRQQFGVPSAASRRSSTARPTSSSSSSWRSRR
jgi:acyl-CoA dehydrogenase